MTEEKRQPWYEMYLPRGWMLLVIWIATCLGVGYWLGSVLL